ncbi:MAG: polysaccharide biosynthesis protein [Deltaproteobacteria bacterium]|nr:polysaccharide biosynthesis protein [Deltaproteobacteria bacterium]
MRAPSLRWNVVANVAARGWNAALSILIVPAVVQAVGAEAYGLVGFFAGLSVFFGFLDLGLSGTANREIARNVALGRDGSENKNLIRTFEVVYWAIALCIGGGLAGASGWIADHWIEARYLSAEEVHAALLIGAGAIMLQWPTSLYSGVLRGLEAQVLQSGISIAAAAIRSLGALAVVWFVSPTVTAYVMTFAVANAAEMLATCIAAWLLLRRSSSAAARARWSVFREVWRFALSFNLVGVLLVALAQGDRLVTAGFLPLDQLGYYSVASTASGGVAMIAWSVSIAVFPRFAGLSAAGNREALRAEYHRAAQVNCFFVVGIALAVTLFAGEVLRVWTGSDVVARAGAPALSLLGAASLLAGAWNAPHTLLVASGHTRVPLVFNAICLAGAVPAWLVMIPRFGIVGAAAVWLGANVVFFFAYLVAAHRRVLAESAWTGVRRDFLGYLVAGVLTLGAGRALTWTRGTWAGCLGLAVGGLAYIAVAWALARRLDVFPARRDAVVAVR